MTEIRSATSITCIHNSIRAQKRDSKGKAGNGSLLMLFQAAFGLLKAFSASVEGSVSKWSLLLYIQRILW